MWGNSSNYPSISSYKEAQQKHDSIKPLRGRQDDFRPLDIRSSSAKAHIEKRGEEYALFCYNTEIVRYYPNGDVWVSRGGWCSTTTCRAISALSPFACYLNKNEVVVTARAGKYAVPTAHKFILLSGGLLFKPDIEGTLVPVSPPVAIDYRKRVLKDKAKIARTLFKDIPPRIMAYSAAFEGGTKPERVKTPSMMTEVSKRGIITEEEIELIAWDYVPERYDWQARKSLIARIGKRAADAFWKAVYANLDIIETYPVELPYGEVPK